MAHNPDVVALFPELIDSSMNATFSNCPKQFYHEYILGLRGEGKNIHLHAGGCIATGLETFYYEYFANNRTFSEALMRAQAAFTIEWNEFVPPKDSPKTEANCWDAIEHYLRVYPPTADNFQPMVNPATGSPTVEFSFSIPLTQETTGLPFPMHPVTGKPILYAGRFDGFGLFGTRIAIKDDKTTSQFQRNWSEKWDLRAQFLGYVWACQQHGYDVDTVLVRGIRLTATNRATQEAIKNYSPHLIERWLHQLFRNVHRMVNCWNEKYWDYNFGDACGNRFGSLCPFTVLCKAREPESWYSSYVITRWNPLAKEHKALLAVANEHPDNPIQLESEAND